MYYTYHGIRLYKPEWSTVYKVSDAVMAESRHFDRGIYSFHDLPGRLQNAIVADLSADNWHIPAVLDGDAYQPFGSRDTIISTIK